MTEHIAFIDESMRDSMRGGLYLVAAVVLTRGDQAVVERSLRGALGGRRRRVHWHGESEVDRAAFVDLLAAQPLRGVCTAVQPLVPRRQERGRELALWTLVAHLERLHVVEMTLEAREDRLNARDRRTMMAVRRAGIGKEMRYEFARPDRRTPILWAADALAGAVGPAVAEGDDRYLKRLPTGFVTTYEVHG